MNYTKLKPAEFFQAVGTEEKAREMIWRSKNNGKDFICPKCGAEDFYQFKKEVEIRKCKSCRAFVRLRVGTIFENSKTPLLVWVWAIYLAMQDKRGISALQLKRQLGMKSYGTTWVMLHKIREALQQRDARYKLKNVIELDGAVFGRRQTGTQTEVLVAVESKDWVDEKGRVKSRAGFAKIVVNSETKQNVQTFVDQSIETNSMVNTDGSSSLRDLKNVDADYQVMGNNKEILDHWLPWIHKFISNAKSWLIGTHHGVESKYLTRYLAEYTYRFNRRHDPDGLFHRALTACAIATPIAAGSLFG